MTRSKYYTQKYNETGVSFYSSDMDLKNIKESYLDKGEKNYVPLLFEIQTEYQIIKNVECFAMSENILDLFFPNIKNIFTKYKLIFENSRKELLFNVNEILEYCIRNNMDFKKPTIQEIFKQKSQSKIEIEEGAVELYYKILIQAYKNNEHIIGIKKETDKHEYEYVLLLKKKDISRTFIDKDVKKINKDLSPILIHYANLKYLYILYDLNEIIDYSIKNKIKILNKGLETVILERQIELELKEKTIMSKKINKI